MKNNKICFRKDYFLFFLLVVFISFGLVFLFQSTSKVKTFATRAAIKLQPATSPMPLTPTPTPVPKKVLFIGDSNLKYGMHPNYYDVVSDLLVSTGRYTMVTPPEYHPGLSAIVVEEDLKNGFWSEGAVFIKREGKPELIPDILVIRLGANDVSYSSKELDDSINSFKYIIHYYVKLNSNLKIVIDQIPFMNGNRYVKKKLTTTDSLRIQLNKKLYNMSLNLNSSEDIKVVLGNDAQLTSDDLINGGPVHANLVGVEKLAKNIFKTISAQ